jgi:hypothetical protein
MQQSNVVPIVKTMESLEWSQGLDERTVHRVRCAARENVELLRGGIGQCIHIALEGSEDVAATMIDYAVQLNALAKDATKRYDVAAARWNFS